MKEIILISLACLTLVSGIGYPDKRDIGIYEEIEPDKHDTGHVDFQDYEDVRMSKEPTEDPAEDPTEDPAEDPTEDPAEDPTEDPAEPLCGCPVDVETPVCATFNDQLYSLPTECIARCLGAEEIVEGLCDE